MRLGLDESKEFRVDDVPEVEAAKLALELAERTTAARRSSQESNAIALGDAEQCDDRLSLGRPPAPPGGAAGEAVVPELPLGPDAPGDPAEGAGRLLDPRPSTAGSPSGRVAVGERVIAMFPGGKLVTLLRIDPLRLSLTVPEQEMAAIKVGQTVTFRTDAFPGRTFKGTVRYITPAVAGDSRSLCVEAVVPNPGRRAAARAVRHRGTAAGRAADRALRAPGGGPQPRRRGGGVRRPRAESFASRSSRSGESAAGQRAHHAPAWRRARSSITTPEQVRDGDPE